MKFQLSHLVLLEFIFSMVSVLWLSDAASLVRKGSQVPSHHALILPKAGICVELHSY